MADSVSSPAAFTDNNTIVNSLNTNLCGMGLSATLEINERSKQLQASGKRIYCLGLGQSPFPVPDLVAAALAANAHQKDYLPVKGLPSLRQAVAEFHQRNDNINCSANDVLIGPGSKELMFILQLVYSGELMIPAPSWVSYAPQAQILGQLTHWIPTQAKHHWRLTAADLELACKQEPNKPRLLILNYPCNPTGHSYNADELQQLAIIAKRYCVLVLSDEIYGLLHFDGSHVSIASYYPEGTIISNGISKWCGAGGWRLGTFVFPQQLRWLLDAMAVVASETFTSVSAPIQHAAIVAYKDSDAIKEYLHQSRRILKALAYHCTDILRTAGVQVIKPEGGFYLFPNFQNQRNTLIRKGIINSRQLCKQLLEDTGVAILPGDDFGRSPEELTTRLAFVDFDGGQAMAAARQLRSDDALSLGFLMRHCPHVIEAVKRITAWLE